MKGCITANISNIDRICYKGLIRIRLQHRCVYQVTKRHILSICKTAGITTEVSLPNIFYTIYGGSDGKSICLQLRRPGFDPWVGKIPWRRKWQPTPVLLPWKSHGRKSLAGYSPWGRSQSWLSDFTFTFFQFSSVAQSCLTLCDLKDCSLPYSRPPCLLPTPEVYPSFSCPLSQWCHPTISSSVVPFSSCPQSFPASGSFPISQFFTSRG